MDETKLAKQIAYCKWIWLIGSTVALASALITLAVLPGPLATILTVITAVQIALAVPAAIVLSKRQPWARITLMLLALLCIAGLYSAFKAEAWPSLILNLILGSTYGVLGNKHFKAAYQNTKPVTDPSPGS